jgi:hypothetical protein
MPRPKSRLFLAATLVLAAAVPAIAQVTFSDDTITYQGRLKRDGALYSGGLQVRVTVIGPLGEPAGPTVTSFATASDGLFTIRPDLGSIEPGLPARRLRVEVKTAADTDFVLLTPDQILTRTPGAVVAERSLATDAIAATSYPNLTLVVSQRERSNVVSATNPWQAFAPAADANLTHLSIPTGPQFLRDNVRLRIYAGSGVGGTILHEQRVGLAVSGESLLALSRPVPIAANTFYTWELAGDFTMVVSATDVLPGESSSTGRDFAFNAYSSVFPNLLLRGNRVGIGLGNPLSPLHVFSREPFNTQYLESNHPAGTWLNMGNSSGKVWSLVSTGGANTEGAGSLLFRDSTESLVHMMLNAAGDLGLGTINPGARLHVTGGGNISQGQTPFVRLGPAGELNLAVDANEIQVRNNTATAALFLNAQGGNVAIGGGGSGPQSPLHVFGGTDLSLANGGYIILGPVAQANLALDENEIQARVNGAASDLLVNASGGNVGIGGGSADAKLHVQNGSDLSLAGGGFAILGATNGSNLVVDDNELQARLNGNVNTLFLNFEGGAVQIGNTSVVNPSTSLAVNGNASKPGGGLWAALSDRKAKTDIKPLSGTLDRLLQLHGYSFRYTDEALAQGGALPGPQLGLMAQEVQQVFPDWVFTDEQGRLNVAERATTALMIEALRDLRAEKDAEIAERDAKIAELGARLERLEKAISTDR